ncbi:DUF397 domain-containing protein [Actinoalloteichus sp. AHMU CJ021]|uniref:DUF397 domain-containing protein n=2 Tax=Pseudonocardiaceae TaxID=2070 RepID=A0ABT1JF71_ACTCY|nr:DUF397 domain-containing protein [Actinoalloteichus caeruleus]AUS80428.1 DUF397 domain-containing protein [Actinoalloteichus sp. AHMU CJ021]MCP2331147.1 protein of unknown function (DUF397) [Actinoalloteichus caeruleus DSM 43889]
MQAQQQPRWRTSSHSGSQSDCVEVACEPDVVSIRDTKNRDGGTLVVDRAAFGAFVKAVKTERL